MPAPYASAKEIGLFVAMWQKPVGHGPASVSAVELGLIGPVTFVIVCRAVDCSRPRTAPGLPDSPGFAERSAATAPETFAVACEVPCSHMYASPLLLKQARSDGRVAEERGAVGAGEDAEAVGEDVSVTGVVVGHVERACAARRREIDA